MVFRPTCYSIYRMTQLPQRNFFASLPRLHAASNAEDSTIMSGYSQDEVIFTIQTKCQTIEKLLEFEQENRH